MALTNVLWKLASPYDAYVSHVVKLNHALGRIRYLSEANQLHRASLEGTVRIASGGVAPDVRAARFREQMTTVHGPEVEGLEDVMELVGGGEPARHEQDRERALTRIDSTERALAEHFAVAEEELRTLVARGYNPARRDIARQLRENHLPTATVEEYRRQLDEFRPEAAAAIG